MIELGELERNHEAFDQRKVRVIASSDDPLEDAQETQRNFPHLTVLSDAEQKMAKAWEVIHPGAGQTGDDTNAPTVFIVDSAGKVRWLSRPARFAARNSPSQIIAALDETLGKSS